MPATLDTVARYRLTVAYDGTEFHGWQRQTQPISGAMRDDSGNRPHQELRTVQHVLQQAVQQVVREPVDVVGASRTDAGVHAWHQTASFAASDDRRGAPDERLVLAINSNLPSDVLVRSCVRTHDDFNPIADCISKGYRYSLHVSRDRPLWDRRYVRHVWEDLDHVAMQAAAARLVGEHDFAAFATSGHGRDNTVRNVISCDVQRPRKDRIEINVAANGFLWNMVRIIAGTLVEVGRGKLTPDDVSSAIKSGDRRAAGPTLVPDGLCLVWARYPGDADDANEGWGNGIPD